MSGLRNWWKAKPWRGWRYRTIYRHMRMDAVHPRTGKILWEGKKPLKALWYTISFPHIHEDDEE